MIHSYIIGVTAFKINQVDPEPHCLDCCSMTHAYLPFAMSLVVTEFLRHCAGKLDSRQLQATYHDMLLNKHMRSTRHSFGLWQSLAGLLECCASSRHMSNVTSFYLPLFGACMAVGGAMEIFMIQTGFYEKCDRLYLRRPTGPL